MLRAVAPSSLVLAQSHAPATKTDANTTEALLWSMTLPGGTLGPNDTLRLWSRWNFPNTASTKIMTAKLGGTIISGHAWISSNASAGIVTLLSNRGALNSQIVTHDGWGGAVGSHWNGFPAVAINTAVNQTLSLHAAWEVAGTGTEAITLESVIVELLRA